MNHQTPAKLSDIEIDILDQFEDVGKFLYRHVHALHHKSYNPTAFSGTNMHPVESTLYYTAAFIPCLWGGHPILGLKTDYNSSLNREHFNFSFDGNNRLCYWCLVGSRWVPMAWKW